MEGNDDSLINLDINPRIVAALHKAKLKSIAHILTLSVGDLMRLTRLSLNDIGQLHHISAHSVQLLPPVSALHILKNQCVPEIRRHILSSGCQVIDELLKGGLRSGMLTEISGESAAGKTQFCLQLCLTVQLPLQWGGLHGKAVYISTEDVFPVKRLVDMANKLKKRFKECKDTKFTDNVTLGHVVDFEHLQRFLSNEIHGLLSDGKVKLLVVDSVAAVMRGEQHGNDSFLARSKNLSIISGLLYNICAKYNIHVILINQVVDDFGDALMPAYSSVFGHTSRKLPALGLSWATMMTVRLALSRTSKYVRIPCSQDKCDKPGTQGEYLKTNVRVMEVLSAPHLSNSFCSFVVDGDGVKGLR